MSQDPERRGLDIPGVRECSWVFSTKSARLSADMLRSERPDRLKVEPTHQAISCRSSSTLTNAVEGGTLTARSALISAAHLPATIATPDISYSRWR